MRRLTGRDEACVPLLPTTQLRHVRRLHSAEAGHIDRKRRLGLGEGGGRERARAAAGRAARRRGRGAGRAADAGRHGGRPQRRGRREVRSCRKKSAGARPRGGRRNKRQAGRTGRQGRRSHAGALMPKRGRRWGEPPSRRAAEPPSRRAAEPPSRRAAEPPSRRAAEPPSRRAALYARTRLSSRIPKARRRATGRSRLQGSAVARGDCRRTTDERTDFANMDALPSSSRARPNGGPHQGTAAGLALTFPRR